MSVPANISQAVAANAAAVAQLVQGEDGRKVRKTCSKDSKCADGFAEKSTLNLTSTVSKVSPSEFNPSGKE